jgi:predicted cobalt transporter CbtA
MRTIVGNGVELAGYAAYNHTVLPQVGKHPELPVQQLAQIAKFQFMFRHLVERIGPLLWRETTDAS